MAARAWAGAAGCDLAGRPAAAEEKRVIWSGRATARTGAPLVMYSRDDLQDFMRTRNFDRFSVPLPSDRPERSYHSISVRSKWKDSQTVVVRYMGTKRHMADHVSEIIANLEPRGRVVDLFSGMGSVAESLQNVCSVVTNDALSFTAAISRARFLGEDRDVEKRHVMERLVASYRERYKELRAEYEVQIKAEDAALGGKRADLADYMTTAQHVGNNLGLRQRAQMARTQEGRSHYQLATLYFGAGYLSLRQAIEVDSIRYAIDSDDISSQRDWLLASWLLGLSVLINAPGHTAQFLKPTTESSHARIVRTWRRSVWDEFGKALAVLSQVGTTEWRSSNTVLVGDALDFVCQGKIDDIGAIYADPPYTKDQYSRYYHVYETLYRYDFPDSNGAGRSRSDRFTTGFSLKTEVIASFRDLGRNVARMDVPLVLSYPSSGLLSDAGMSVHEALSPYFKDLKHYSFAANHSTLGASTGKQKHATTENLYVYTP